jgi:hypothetical protein
MKPYQTKLLLAVFLAALLLTGCSSDLVSDEGLSFETFPGQFLVGDVYVLRKHQKIDGDIAGIGTTLIIEDGALVMGDISLVGSTLEIDGRVAGELNIFAGSSVIRDTAIIAGDVNQVFTAAEIVPNALVTGAINTYIFPNFSRGPSGEEITDLLSWLRPQRIFLFKLGQVLAMMLATLIVISLFADPTLKVTRAINSNLPAAWGAGLLSYIAAPIISLVFIITICLSPVGLLVLIAFLLSLLWGWVALASIIGNQVKIWFRLDLGIKASAILGAAVFGVGTALISFIPCLGFFINMVIASFGTGGVLLSRFGTYEDEKRN